ncbi:hypothetical protein [Leptospira borgpetersenii]|nr:hypothetical protein [Leptospira borgpetersenii]
MRPALNLSSSHSDDSFLLEMTHPPWRFVSKKPFPIFGVKIKKPVFYI